MLETNDTTTVTKQKIAFTVEKVGEGYMLIDHRDHLWLNGKDTGMTSYLSASHVQWQRTTEADAWLDIPNDDVWQIVARSTVVASVTVRRPEDKYYTSFDRVELDEAQSVREQLRNRLPRIVYTTFEGELKSVDMFGVKSVEVGAARKVIDR